MKVSILIFFLVFSFRGYGLCLPDSLESNHKSVTDLVYLEDTVIEAQDALSRFLSPDYEILLKLEMLNSRTNAEIKKNGNKLVLEIFGGMLNHPKMNQSSLKLLLCHEIGHALGGPPMKSRGGWSSTEGQADYYSGLACSKFFEMSESDFIDGALDLTSIYADVMNENIPQLDQCDGRKVERINFGYPSVQCRLDTIIAGWRGQPRPLCWYAP